MPKGLQRRYGHLVSSAAKLSCLEEPAKSSDQPNHLSYFRKFAGRTLTGLHFGFYGEKERRMPRNKKAG